MYSKNINRYKDEINEIEAYEIILRSMYDVEKPEVKEQLTFCELRKITLKDIISQIEKRINLQS